MESQIEKVQQAVRAFRRVIDEADRSQWELNLVDFPAGCCGPISELLGHSLLDICGIVAGYVYGERGSQEDGTWCSHAWLEWEGWIIDITSDQFDRAPVIFTRDREWHDQWKQRHREPGEFCLPGPDWPAGPYRAWSDIKKSLANAAAS